MTRRLYRTYRSQKDRGFAFGAAAGDHGFNSHPKYVLRMPRYVSTVASVEFVTFGAV